MSREQVNWLRLARTENVGPITFFQLIKRYGHAGEALKAIPELAAKGGLKRKLTMPSVRAIEDELYALDKLGARVLCHGEADYPRLLANLVDAPPVITLLGHAALLTKPCVAIVGARNASINGIRFAEKLAHELGEAGYTVVSGLAAGIDAAAHRGALTTGTVGVVAGGIDVVYPPENEKLWQQVATQGAVLAEMPLGFGIRPQLFIRRNRIVSGLALGVVVVEAAMKSGSLTTARLAGEQGREVMAVPGSPLDARSGGTNHLIRDGATLVTSTEDVLEVLSSHGAEDAPAPTFEAQPLDNIEEKLISAAQERIVNVLSPTPCPVDAVIRLCEMPAPVVAAALLELELAGRVARSPGNMVALLGKPDLAEVHETG